MPGSARVESVAAIENFRGALARYELRAQGALETLTAELRRALDWLEHQQPAYWKEQSRVASDDIHQAKKDLQRCLMFAVADERPSCREEKANLNRAKVRLELCREKAEKVKHWNRQFNHELFEYEGRVGQLRRMLETELPAARAKLQQIVRRIDAYQIERSPMAVDPLEQAPVHETEESD